MTLTAKEAMQALLDGKTVYQMDYDLECTHMFKLSEKGWIVEWFNDSWCASSYLPLNDIEGVIEEYPLSFEQALHAMLDGKVVECEATPILRQRFCNGQFEYLNFLSNSNWGLSEYLREKEQKAKWKVVE